ncbi:MAG: chlorophyll synthase ChlG [Gammaproteobacteria bacterium]
MSRTSAQQAAAVRPAWSAYLELLKPITWFPPMWAFACGLVASGAALGDRWLFVLGGIALTGPLVCGTSQVVNDWFDRHGDAINQPERPIPSGRVPGRQGLWYAIIWTVLSLVVAAALGPWVFGATITGQILAWAYSAPPFRLKTNGWWGNSAVGLCYEGLPWITAAAVLSAAMPSWHSMVAALLYSAGAHGIMTLNDFKSIEGDRKMGIRSLPARYGPEAGAKLACWFMAVPQIGVVGLLAYIERPIHAAAVGLLLIAQLFLMRKLNRDPLKLAPWYNATGVTLFVSGMMVTAFAIRSVLLT